MSSLHAATKIAIFHVSQQIASLTIFRTVLPPLTLVLTNFSKNCHFIKEIKGDAISPIIFNFWRNHKNCRNHSFCWAPFYLLYHLNLVILAKTAISPIFCKKLKTSKLVSKGIGANNFLHFMPPRIFTLLARQLDNP